jgi:predicted acylesterase/phospholipase RssA
MMGSGGMGYWTGLPVRLTNRPGHWVTQVVLVCGAVPGLMAGNIREYLHDGAVHRDIPASVLEILMIVIAASVDGVRDSHKL